MKIHLGFAVATIMFSIAGCSDATAPVGPIAAHGVVMSLEVPGRCLLTCDPVSTEVHTVGLLTVRNTSATVVYLHQCGSTPAISEEQLVGGEWVTVGPVVSCAFAPTPITIAAGDSLLLNWLFATGRRRLVLGVATQASMSDEAIAASGSVDIK